MKNYFGRNLKYLRKLKNLKQPDVGEFLGKTSMTVSNYEQGKSEPDLQDVQAVREYFDITYEQLIDKDLEDIGFELDCRPVGDERRTPEQLVKEAYKDPSSLSLFSKNQLETIVLELLKKLDQILNNIKGISN